MKQYITYEELRYASFEYRHIAYALESVRNELSTLSPILEKLADSSDFCEVLKYNQDLLKSLFEISNKLQFYSDCIDKVKEELEKLVPPSMN